MAFLRSLAFTILFYGGSVPIVLFGVIASVFRPAIVMPVADTWAAYFLWLTRHMLGIRLQVRGTIPQTGVIVAAKHQSAFETITLARIFDRPAPVMKAELMSIPFWGRLARLYGSIPVDRDGSGKTLRAMMTAAKRAVADGRPIVIFPEGSRMPVGEAPPLKAGIAGIYKLLRVPVVPLALDSGLLWPRRSFTKHAGTITLEFGEPIPAGLERDEFEARLHAAINKDV